MKMATQISLASDVWTSVAGLLLRTCRIENVLVVMDDSSAELCHWAGAVDHFLDCVSVTRFPILDYHSLETSKDKTQVVAFILNNIADSSLEYITLTLRTMKPHTCFLFIPYYPSVVSEVQ